MINQICQALEYTCINKTTQLIVKTSDFTACDKSLGFVTSKWDCSMEGFATLSAQLQGQFEVATASAQSFGQATVLLWFGLVVILTYVGFMIGAYIYRK
jgi:hypothetical protein